MIFIDGIGTFEPDGQGWCEGRQHIYVPALGLERRFVLEAYEDDENPDEFYDEIRNFIAMDRRVLDDAQEHVFAFYSQIKESGWGEPPEIGSAGDVWTFVRFGTEPFVSRRTNGDKKVYVSLECGCAWEQEHGLQMVFREGNFINKIGPFDGHLSNADAFDSPSRENTVFCPWPRRTGCGWAAATRSESK